MEGFRTIATRASRLGRISSAHAPATTRSARRRVGGTSPGAIDDQELLLDNYGLSHDGTCAAGPTSRMRVATRCRNRNGQVAYDTMLS